MSKLARSAGARWDRKQNEGRTKPKGCGKVRYRTRLDALIDAASVASKGKDGTRVYRCPLCGGWHRTSQQKGVR